MKRPEKPFDDDFRARAEVRPRTAWSRLLPLSQSGADDRDDSAADASERVALVDRVTFEEAWPNRVEVARDGVRVPFIGVEEFLKNKDASGRDQGRVDAANVRRRMGRL